MKKKLKNFYNFKRKIMELQRNSYNSSVFKEIVIKINEFK